MRPAARRGIGLLAALLVAGSAAARGEAPVYDVEYQAQLVPRERSARVRVIVRQPEPRLLSLVLRADPERHLAFEGDGEVAVGEDGVSWTPPERGGELRYTFRIDHLRDEQRYDARCSDDWAIFRGDDLVPPARVRTRSGARSRARLRLRLPAGWSAAVRYPREDDGRYAVRNEARRFDRPTGWMVAARRLGVVRERVAGVRVAIAGPAGHDLHRMDLLALLGWTLPHLRKALGDLPPALLVVGAGDPMWRGGLSGPGSLFLHASRPLISGDGTSPVLHEVFHAVAPGAGAAGDDWLVEGLAEYYGIELLVRSGTLSRDRHEKTMAKLARRGRDVASVRVKRAHGDVTARAVVLLAELDVLIRKRSEGRSGLDGAVRALVAAGPPFTTRRLQEEAERAAGASLEGFFSRPELAPRRGAGQSGMSAGSEISRRTSLPSS